MPIRPCDIDHGNLPDVGNRKTQLLRAQEPSDIATAVALLGADQVVGLPTETVYGLAANALEPAAVAAIFTAKQRPSDNPLIVHVTGAAQAFDLTHGVSRLQRSMAMALMESFWPGPLTLILPKNPIVPDLVTASRDDVGLRCPAHPVFQEVLEACGFPLAAPSANPAGKPSPTTATQVLLELDGRIPAVLDGGSARVGVESTVLSLVTSIPCLLRPGGVTIEQLEGVVGSVCVDPAVRERLTDGRAPAAPGMKYRHYSPNTPLEIFPGTPKEALAYLAQRRSENIGILGFSEYSDLFNGYPYISYGPRNDGETQARRLFSALRDIDTLGVSRVLAFAPPSETGVFLAVTNRLLKAAGFTQTAL